MSSLIKYVSYDEVTGEIKSTGKCTSASLAAPYLVSGVSLLEVVSATQEENYIDVGTLDVLVRPAMPTSIDKTAISADGSDACSVTDIPTGSIVAVDSVLLEGVGMLVNDGFFEFTTEEAGEYTIYIRHFPHQQKEYEIVAT